MKPLLSLGLFALFAACGGGSSAAGDGSVSLVLTDAATDELSQFEVDVSDVVFQKVAGSTVSVLPRKTRVDFLQLESLSELVAVATLEAGVYERITLNLDFSTASIVIAGKTTPAAVIDQAGDPITGTFNVDIDLRSNSRRRVAASRGNLFVLDLDLDQSISVDATGNVVTFSPVWTVDTDPDNPKPVVVTGLLQSFDPNTRVLQVERRAVDDTVIGVFAVRTGLATVFQLGGVVQVGDLGLGSLTSYLSQRIWVQGTFNATANEVRAVAVETGAGVPGNGQDWVFGHVVGRSGAAGADATLTVLGRSHDVGTAARTYNTLHTVSLSHADTKVLRRGVGNSYDSDDVNVGQLVWVFGDLTGTALDATAATGVARLLPTSIFGVPTGAVSGTTLTLDVTRFDLRDVSLFDFDVSGQVQADPDAFTIDVDGLSTTGIDTDSRLRVRGWIRGVGSAGADAEAFAIVDRASTSNLLFCAWAPALQNVLDAGTAGAVGIDVSAALLKFVANGFSPITLAASPEPSLQAAGSSGVYRIVQDGGVVVYTSFSEFRTALQSRLSGTAVRQVSAIGLLDASTQVFAAVTATVVLQ